jgi:DNA helicase-2/ATP-dependent DNA helicase PcrA
MLDNLSRELNDKQLEAVTSIEGPLLIIAGAGSGKTASSPTASKTC